MQITILAGYPQPLQGPQANVSVPKMDEELAVLQQLKLSNAIWTHVLKFSMIELA